MLTEAFVFVKKELAVGNSFTARRILYDIVTASVAYVCCGVISLCQAIYGHISMENWNWL